MKRTLFRLIVSCSVLAGCASPQPSFHTLQPRPGVLFALPLQRDLLVGPATLPAALDRPAIVISPASGTPRPLDQQRWLGDLAHTLDEVLAANLTQRTGQGNTHAWPQPGPDTLPLRLLVDVRRFDLMPGSGVALTVDWRIMDSKEGTRLAAGHFEQQTALNDPAIPALLRAQEALLGQLGDTIAAALATLPPR